MLNDQMVKFVFDVDVEHYHDMDDPLVICYIDYISMESGTCFDRYIIYKYTIFHGQRPGIPPPKQR
jgi:hypothetical protein